MSRGLGAFAKGLTDGYITGAKMKSQREKDEREKEEFGLRKQKTELELQALEREEAFKKDMGATLKTLEAEARGGVTGRLMYEDGTVDPNETYIPTGMGTPAGAKWDPSTVKERPPMEPIAYQRRVADALKMVATRHGKIDLAQLEQARKFDQKIEAEGAIEAYRYALSSGDFEGAKKMFNEKGNVKIGDDIQLSIKDGLFGPELVGFRTGKDGKQTEVFNGFRDIILPSMSAEAFATTMAGFAQTQAKEQGDTFRTGITAQATRDAAAAKAGSSTELTLKDKLEMVSKRVSENLKSVLGNSAAALDADRRRAIESEIGALAEQMITKDPRVGVEQAANAATDAVYRKYGIVSKK